MTFSLEVSERLPVAEEAGDVDEEIAREGLHLPLVLSEQQEIGAELDDAVDAHAPLDAAGDGGGLVVGEVDPALLPDQAEDLVERLLVALEALAERARVAVHERLTDVALEVLGELDGTEHEVGETRR